MLESAFFVLGIFGWATDILKRMNLLAPSLKARLALRLSPRLKQHIDLLLFPWTFVLPILIAYVLGSLFLAVLPLGIETPLRQWPLPIIVFTGFGIVLLLLDLRWIMSQFTRIYRGGE